MNKMFLPSFLKSILRSFIGLLISFLMGLLVSGTLQGQEILPPCHTLVSPSTCAKIGQMLIVGFGGLDQNEEGRILWEDKDGTVFNPSSAVAKAIKQYHIGGVILFNRLYFNQKTGEFIRPRNIQSPEQVQALNKELQKYSTLVRQQENLPPLPLFISIDQEGGMIDRLPWTSHFPLKTMIPQAFGANQEMSLNDPEQKKKALLQTLEYAKQMAVELKDYHFNLNFSPCVDVNLNPLNFVIGGRGRSFSSDPTIVADQALQFVRAFQEQHIVPTLKHFPGHGSSVQDSHDGLVEVTQSYDKEKELLPFRQLIQNGYQGIIMSAHVINGQIDQSQCKMGAKEDSHTWCPGTLSKATLTTLLREQMGFKGVIITDDLTMGAIANEYPIEVALEKAINAGVDMFIISNNTQDQTEKLVSTIALLIKQGKVTEAQIERAHQHIIDLKRKLILE